MSRRDFSEFLNQLGVFFVIALVLLVLNVAQRWLSETLKLKLREGLVRDLVGEWLKPHRAFRLAKAGPVGIEDKGATIVIGGMTTHMMICTDKAIAAKIPGLSEMASWIGDNQVRHRGTMGGSLANNDPSACYPTAVLACHSTQRARPAPKKNQ